MITDQKHFPSRFKGKLKAAFTPSRWRSVAIYVLRGLLQKVDKSTFNPQRHEVEELMYRYILCAECMNDGGCVNHDCHCAMPGRAHVRTDFCPSLRWGPTSKTEEEWIAKCKEEGLVFVLMRTGNCGDEGCPRPKYYVPYQKLNIS